VHRILQNWRDVVIESRSLEATACQVDNMRIADVFDESGLPANVIYAIDRPAKRSAGFKLSAGMQIPEELASKFKFARQKSKLAEPSAAPTSRSRTCTDSRTGSAKPVPPGPAVQPAHGSDRDERTRGRGPLASRLIVRSYDDNARRQCAETADRARSTHDAGIWIAE